ncbi:MAG: anhydro-N-acetylmuramic acid kinase [Crocinitomicaceae bacterium]|jgi:anhydro-N-acetylmuramic acid kinase|nr:anhydro-N-acetylmuramic acid kinase [Crocinitomicaceae bacterium]
MLARQIIGLMSGTSLDGLDIVLAQFNKTEEGWSYDIKHAKTYKWNKKWREKLGKGKNMSSPKLFELDKALGKEMGKMVNLFIKEFTIDQNQVSAIASHGHTIFHQPKKGFSAQIGCGTSLAFETGIQVINDFRNADIICGGQGAPLVPIGDKLLFGQQADAFLNLGGFCNISFKKNRTWIAFDIAPCNLPLNALAQTKDMKYDRGGKLASKGKISFFLLDLLNRLSYYKQSPPKSLGTEWLEEAFFPMIKFSNSTKDNLCTVVEHIAIQISNVIEQNNLKSIFVTGGGAKNDFLIRRIQHHSKVDLILPDQNIIDFKEALIFAFLGELYLSKIPNTIPSVTGAKKATIAGVLHRPLPA